MPELEHLFQEYNPVKAHQYYEAHKQLKGRPKAVPKRTTTSTHTPRQVTSTTKKPAKLPANAGKMKTVNSRIGRLRSAVQKLQGALSEAEAALSAKRQTARKTKKASSDGKTTVKERQSSQTYRDKHQAEIKSKAKTKSAGSSTSSSKSVSDMDVQELTARVIKIRGALQDAKKQLATATHELGQLAHSAITSDPNVDTHFAQFAISRKDSVT
jgi:chromosome segregation ATPase